MTRTFFSIELGHWFKSADTEGMGMLDRYKKPGGFNQLLTLLETSGKQKQEKFLEIIRMEDPRWADALMAKMIDLDRVLTWNTSVLAEITGSMLEINVAAVIKSLPVESQSQLLDSIGSIKKRKVLDIMESTNPSAADVATSVNKLLEMVRKLSQDGKLRFDKFDPLLFVEADIEDKLKHGRPINGVPDFSHSFGAQPDVTAQPANQPSPSSNAKEARPNSAGLHVVTSLDAKAWADSNAPKAASAAASSVQASQEAELAALKKRIASLQAENGSLRQELALAMSKLEQIRKIA